MKYAPFTTWDCEGTIIEEFDNDKLFDSIEDAQNELAEIFAESDSYYGILAIDGDCIVKTFVNDYDFTIVDGKVEMFTEERAKAIREAENRHFRELFEEVRV